MTSAATPTAVPVCSINAANLLTSGTTLPAVLRLEAHNPARNLRRFYEITVGIDLLGDLVVTVRNGRCGCRGWARVVAVVATVSRRRGRR